MNFRKPIYTTLVNIIFPILLKRIIQLEGKLDAKDRKHSNTPLHLIYHHSNIETLKKYL